MREIRNILASRGYFCYNPVNMPQIPLLERMAIMTGRGAKEVLGSYIFLEPKYLENKRVLNVGAGRTNLEKDLLEKYGVRTNVTNIDLAYDPRRKSWYWYLIWKAPVSSFPKNAIQADMCSLPFSDDYFDISISTASLSSWTSKDRSSLALLELCRVTKNEIYISPVLERDHHLIQAQNKLPGSHPKFLVEISNDSELLKLRRK